VSQNTVAEIMAELGLQGCKAPRQRRSLTRPGKRKAAQVRRHCARRAVVGRHDGDRHRRGQALPRIRPRCVLRPGPGLRDGRAPRCRAGQRRPADGDRDPRRPSRRRHLPREPRQRIHP
jgi:hypothetical protein